MRTLAAISAAFLPLLFSLSIALAGDMRDGDLGPGMPAPDFELTDQNGEVHRLADYRGRWLVMYFYPRDDTPGCTAQACGFRDDVAHFRTLGAQVLGVSVDSAESHARFAEKYGLPFPLLADKGGEVARAYGSLRNLGVMKMARRHTFIIDPDGRVARVYRDVDPKTNSAEVIAELARLQERSGSPDRPTGPSS